MSFLEISNNALASVPSTPTVTQQQPQQQPQPQQQDEDNNTGATKAAKETMILTPRTRILSIANEYSMVIMVDLSSSLATTDVNRGNIMIENIHDTYVDLNTYIYVIFRGIIYILISIDSIAFVKSWTVLLNHFRCQRLRRLII